MNNNTDTSITPRRRRLPGSGAAAVVAILVTAPLAAMAQDFGGADTKVSTFFENINGLLTIASIAVVTIAVIFAGYQIAFAHKRISDVAPILIGGFLIGAAAQIARMLLGNEAGGGAGGMASVVAQSLKVFGA
jgi:type IV secretion system protein VirB2